MVARVMLTRSDAANILWKISTGIDYVTFTEHELKRSYSRSKLNMRKSVFQVVTKTMHENNTFCAGIINLSKVVYI